MRASGATRRSTKASRLQTVCALRQGHLEDFFMSFGSLDECTTKASKQGPRIVHTKVSAGLNFGRRRNAIGTRDEDRLVQPIPAL